MEVKIESNPIVSRIWKEWLDKDNELSNMTKEERLGLVSQYQWVFPKETKRMVELESLYSSVHYRNNRLEFHKWFYVVSGYLLSRVHLGDSSYYKFKDLFKKQFMRKKCTSDEFPSQVLLVLAILGYITDLGGWYVFNEGKEGNHGYHYVIDKDKLLHWEDLSNGCTTTISNVTIPQYVVSNTTSISFEEKKGEDTNNMSWTQHPDWLAERQYESICSATVVKEGVERSSRWMLNYDEYQNYYTLSEKEREDLTEEWRSYQKLRDLSCGIVGGCKDDLDKYAGRFYSPMTNMKGDHRHRYLRMDGELVSEVDVSSAQPTFLGIMMYQETGVMSEWLRQSLNGTFYEWIKEMTNTQEDRKTIKGWMMEYMYSCYQATRGKDDGRKRRRNNGNRKDKNLYDFKVRLNKFLEKNEPEIFHKIDWYKKNPVYRDDKAIIKQYVDDKGKKRSKKVGQGKWCSMLSYDLVKMEVKYIKRCIHSLPQDMRFWTIHDCICVKESDSLKVKEIMEKVSREMYGKEITIKLKRENTSKDYS